MPYCSKCGAELDEDAKFCPTCRTPVGPPVAEPERRRKERRPISTLAIVLIALLVIAAVITAIAFLPVRTVRASPYRHSVPRQTGVNTLNLDLAADVAGVNIAFEDLTGEWQSPSYILDASATARVGVFGSPDFLERFMPVCHDTTEGNVLTVTVTQEVDTVGWSWYSSLNVTFDIRIDPSMNTSLDVKTSTGGIVLDTQAGVVLNSLSLEATTGGVEANLVEDVIVASDVSVKTTTGGVKLSWTNVNVTDDVLVNATTTTGGVDVDVTQDEEFLGNVTLRAEAVTGGVDFAIIIRGDVGAKIESSVTTGGINIVRKVGFSGPEALLQSSNYPAGSNFDVSLKTTTGGIDVDAKHTP
ncbi:MAG: zinc-ribbon domain-containing protein [Candidatus Bathyarchaeota archaeon]|nr:zinc-ribbon domain-containing protein [Candidatus Bathyarchaeota archaeon]MDH5663097.1 zinc-ribbon domain-containing protein [Candidatus Bathyarchaeota archaeon]